MVDVVSDLVHETTVTTGTGDKTLSNVSGKRSFNTAFSTGGTNVFVYYLSHRSAAEYQWGMGHLSSASVLVSDTILGSSNAGAAVNFSAGIIDVTNDIPAVNQIAHPQRAGGLTPHENLIVLRASASTVDIDADAVVLFNPQSAGRRYLSLNETLDITASGANGLDTGSEASATWYHIWAIGKEDGTLDGLLSTSATAPTMPAGYTYKGYLGAVRNNAASDFAIFRQDNTVATKALVSGFLSAGTATTYAAVSLAPYIPPTCREVYLDVKIYLSTGTNACRVVLAPYATAGTTTETYGHHMVEEDASTTNGSQCPVWMMFDRANMQLFYYLVGANARVDLEVLGYRF